MNHPLRKRVVAEAVGTAMSVAAVVGSGIMGERLAAGNTAIALLANTIATGAALAALILTFGPISARILMRWSHLPRRGSEASLGERSLHTSARSSRARSAALPLRI